MPEAPIDKHSEPGFRERDIDLNGAPVVDLDTVVLAESQPGAMQR